MQPQLTNLRSWCENVAHENYKALYFLQRMGRFWRHDNIEELPMFSRTRNRRRDLDLSIFFRYWKNVAEEARRDRRKNSLTQKTILAYYCPIFHRSRHGHGALGRMGSACEARASGLFLQERQSRFSRPSWLSVHGKPVGIGWESADAAATLASGLRQ